MRNLFLVFVAVGLLSGCSVYHGDFTVASNKLINTSKFSLDGAPVVKNVEGKDVSHTICIIPTKMSVTIEQAMDNALEKGNGDVMTDVSIRYWSWYIPYIYGQTGYSVKGDVVKTRK